MSAKLQVIANDIETIFLQVDLQSATGYITNDSVSDSGI